MSHISLPTGKTSIKKTYLKKMKQIQVFVTLGVSRKKRLQKNYQSPKNLPKWELGTNSPIEIEEKF